MPTDSSERAGTKKKKEKDLVRERLEQERQRLLEEIRQQSIVGQEHPGYGNHMADDASEVFEQAKSLAIREKLQSLLDQVEKALERINQGTYGLCTRCGARIDPARLEAIPYAALCFDCQQKSERKP
jgi:DnaK suppressor protein